jgi:hypothetical protein
MYLGAHAAKKAMGMMGGMVDVIEANASCD